MCRVTTCQNTKQTEFQMEWIPNEKSTITQSITRFEWVDEVKWILMLKHIKWNRREKRINKRPNGSKEEKSTFHNVNVVFGKSYEQCMCMYGVGVCVLKDIESTNCTLCIVHYRVLRQCVRICVLTSSIVNNLI